jgi:hypothetical protein
VDVPVVEARTVAQLIESQPAENSEALSSRLSPDEERAVIKETLDRHYRSLLDESVPMLGNMTPRRAAKSAKGREKLVTWLKFLENGAAHGGESSIADYNLTWMWEELGVANLRR